MTQHKERILIVEDEGVAALALEAKLTDIGYETAGIAFSADEAVRVSRDVVPDLILMDIQLRGKKDGIDAAQEIGRELDIPVVYVTAYSDERTIARAKETSPFGYLTKPLREEAIRCTIEMAIEKHRLEKRLRQSEERFRTVFFKAARAMALICDDLSIEQANPAFEKLFGATTKAFEGTHLSNLLKWPQPALQPIPEGDVEVQALDGRWIMANASSLVFGSDAKVRMLVTLVDITKRKDNERRLAEAKSAAERECQTKSDLLAHLGHEIRTPLSSMIGYADLLSRGHVASEDKKLFVERIRSCGYQLIEMVNEVLDFSKAEAGLLIIDKEHVDLLEVVRTIVSLLEPQAQNKGVALLLCVDGLIPPRIVTDPRRLRQILINLIGNAIKFTEKGHVAVKIVGGKDIEIEVSDTGCGISEATISTLFTPFKSDGPTLSHRLGGTGLGLSLSKKLAEILGGRLVLSRSAVGQGSAFTLTLSQSPEHMRLGLNH